VRHQRVHPQLVRPEKRLRPVAVNATDPPPQTKSRGVTMPPLIALARRVTINGRNGSIRSSARRRTPEARADGKSRYTGRTHAYTPPSVLRQQAVAQREQRIDGVARRTPVAPREVERQLRRLPSFAGLESCLRNPQSTAVPRCASRPSSSSSDRACSARSRHFLHDRQRPAVRLHVVAAGNACADADFPPPAAARTPAQNTHAYRKPELALPQEDVLTFSPTVMP